MNNEEINKLDMQSKDIVKGNIRKISELFPDCISEGKIDFEMLKQELSNNIIEDGKERYQLTWVGKKDAIVNANTPCNKTLRPVKEKSVDFDNTKNIYIEGDNLEVLKILQESYLNKIKCIYIDPPYNTGKDFIYNDQFINENEMKDSEQVDEYNNRLVSNSDTSGKYHSDWLSMMYPRLKLARNLLTKDGIIFISIDDNEVHNLRKICDEIFGEKNFMAEIAWQCLDTIKNDAKYFSDNHEYILCYAKNKMNVRIQGIKKGDKQKEYYKNYDNDPRGAYLLTPLHAKSGSEVGIYTYVFKNGKSWTPPQGTYPRFSKETLLKLENDNRIYFGSNIPQKKTFLSEVGDRMPPITFWDYANFGSTRQSNKELSNLIGKGMFQNPKSIKLLTTLLDLQSDNKNSTFLDFFSGSATTSEAIMSLNKEDNGNRRYIAVQIPERCNESSEAFKSNYKTICDIGEERIRRAGKKIKEETNAEIDYGFRVYKVDSSNMKDVYYAPTDLQQSQLNMFESNIKEDRTAEDLLTQVILDLGLTLDLSIEERKIINNKVYFVENNSLVACFDDNIDINIVDEICKCNPLKIVFKESSFKTDSDKINVFERIKKLSNDTEINII